MTTPNRSGTDCFVALFESLPRQGPGSRECTARALGMCEQLPPAPRIVDLGCGAGAARDAQNPSQQQCLPGGGQDLSATGRTLFSFPELRLRPPNRKEPS
ncbi:UNVERIFIED_CONTAM: hypothetical protein RF653_05145 [Kocuria sp. CPCC 205316]|uniref:hypothetical protein n=1 Tax=Kocuria TaxID=57493 RepID=UPI0036DCA6C1